MASWIAAIISSICRLIPFVVWSQMQPAGGYNDFDPRRLTLNLAWSFVVSTLFQFRLC